MNRQLSYVIIFLFFTMSCAKQEEPTFDYVTTKFKENAAKITSVQYNDHRIDSSLAQQVYWNKKGTILLERRKNDAFIGFSFYGTQTDSDKHYLYDNNHGFEISHKLQNYTLEHPLSIIGSPGGQQFVKQVFYLDSIYKTAEVFEKNDTYILKYTFENDTLYTITDQSRIIELRKEDFFPIRITYRGKTLGKKTMSQHTLSDIKINDAVLTSIADIKDSISNYDVVLEKSREELINPILNKKFPELNLPILSKSDEKFQLESGKVTLIDFWETWCGPCIRSFPKVEELNRKYKDDLQIIGVVTQNEESAMKLVEKKGISFINLYGDKSVHENFGVNSFPRYFLLDANGIVIKEYFGFSEEIEADIKEILGK